jgi:hypothetical protein
MTLTILSLGAALTLGCTKGDDTSATDDTSTVEDLDLDDDGYDTPDDCDDTNADIHPDATEIPNDGVDQNCDGLEECPADADGDGFGDATATATSASLDCVGEGVAAATDDCDDAVDSTYPGATEGIADGVDSDCDGEEICYVDGDEDGYGTIDATTTTSAVLDCSETGMSNTADDCDDALDNWNPGATEDDCTDPNDYNCDGSVGYEDVDGDGWPACEDCDDAVFEVNPDATEIIGNEVDDDCSGGETCYLDGDDDGYRPDETSTVESTDEDCLDTTEAPSTDPVGDCDDGDSTRNEGATDTPQNGVDEDCSGSDAPYAVTDLSNGDLLFTEVHRNPVAVTDANGEWFEIYNASGGEVDLAGLYVYDADSDSFTVSGETLVADGDYFVFGLNSDSGTNGGATVDYQYSGFSLGNGDDELYMAESSSMATELDSLDWDDDYFPDNAGYSASLDPSYLDVDSNDHNPHWCDPSSTYGDGDYGTPGSSNDSCGFTYTFSGDVSSIFSSTCSTCHTSGSSGSMTSITTWSTTVFQTSSQDSSYYLVDPFSADDSYLWQKLEGTASSGSQMPKTGSVSQTQLDTIETWINEGAPQ